MSSERKLETVLAATDFSSNAENAVAWAQQIAQVHRARLVLFHALAPVLGPTAAPEFVLLPPEVYELHQKRALERLEQVARERSSSQIEISARTATGPDAPTILSAIQAEEAGLVVVGTRGLTGLKRTFLGSVAARVIRHSPCPVLAIPEACGAPRSIRHVLIPTDFSADAELAAETTLRLFQANAADTRVTLLHVWRVPHSFSMWTPEPMESFGSHVVEDARRRLAEVAAPLRNAGFQVEEKLHRGEPEEAIDRAATEGAVDLIAMGTHGRSGLSRMFLGSVAERTLPAAPCPVLTVHRDE